MRRRLAHFLLVVSIAIFAALLVLWVRSYWWADGLAHARPGRQSALWLHRGRLILDTLGDDHVRIWPGLRSALRDVERFSDPITDPGVVFIDLGFGQSRRFLGFTWNRAGSIGLPTRRITTIAIPLWSLALLLSLAPAARLFAAARRRRLRRRRLCVKCRYDLRASADRCPECGTPIDPASPADDNAAVLTPSPRAVCGKRGAERG